MENLALIDSFSEFKDDKLIDRVTLMAILEDVFRNALKKKFGDDDNFDIIINPDKGDLEIWRNRIVVADGEVENENQEISLSEAQKIEPDFVSALKLCKRRRIGAVRPQANRELYYKKDMGILARGGFSFDLSKRVLDLEAVEFHKLIKII